MSCGSWKADNNHIWKKRLVHSKVELRHVSLICMITDSLIMLIIIIMIIIDMLIILLEFIVATYSEKLIKATSSVVWSAGATRPRHSPVPSFDPPSLAE